MAKTEHTAGAQLTECQASEWGGDVELAQLVVAAGDWTKRYLEPGEWQKSQAYIILQKDSFLRGLQKRRYEWFLRKMFWLIRIRVQKQEKEDTRLSPLNRSLPWLLAIQFVQHFCTTRVKSLLSEGRQFTVSNVKLLVTSYVFFVGYKLPITGRQAIILCSLECFVL